MPGTWEPKQVVETWAEVILPDKAQDAPISGPTKDSSCRAPEALDTDICNARRLVRINKYLKKRSTEKTFARRQQWPKLRRKRAKGD